MTRLRFMFLAISLLAFSQVFHAQQSAATAEKFIAAARHRAAVDGDLKGALEDYTRALSAAGSHRALAAQALLGMAEAYELLGDPQARSIYERLVRDFPDHPRAAATARDRLAALRASSHPVGERGMVGRQIWTGEAVDLEGRPSADGRLVSFVDWTGATGNVATRDLVTGEIKHYTHEHDEAAGFSCSVMFSPDGKQLAYTWDYGTAASKSALRLVRVDGSARKSLIEESDTHYAFGGWSPDGRHIVATASAAGTHYIALIATSDGKVTRLKSTAQQYPSIGGFSTDGRFIVYALPSSAGATNGGVFVLAVDGSSEATLVRDGANNRQPFFTPDGRSVVYVSDRSGTNDLWTVPVAERAAPQLLRANLGDVVGLGFSRAGTFFYGTTTQDADVYVSRRGQAASDFQAPARATDRFAGANRAAVWSPDGRLLAFLRGRDDANASIVVRDVTTGDERIVPTRFEHGIQLRWGVEWFPDGQSLLVSEGQDRKRTFWRINVVTGRAERLFDVNYPLIAYGTVAVAKDGKAVYPSVGERTARPNVSRLRLVKRDLASGAEHTLFTADSPGLGLFGLSSSHDGGFLSFSAKLEASSRALMVVPTDGGSAREVYRGDYRRPRPAKTAWSADGRSVIAVSEEASPGTRRNRLLAFPLEGGAPMELIINASAIEFPSMSPDGQQMAFTQVQRRHEMWTLSNLVHGAPSSR
jgi:Tol biopolymer transport system component